MSPFTFGRLCGELRGSDLTPEMNKEFGQSNLSPPLFTPRHGLCNGRSAREHRDDSQSGRTSTRSSQGKWSKSGILHGSGFTIRHNGLSPCSDYNEGSSKTKARSVATPVSDSSSTSPNTNHLFNRLELIPLGSLGKGSSGRVFKAFHVTSLTVVAVKSVQVFDATKQRQVLAEIKALYHNILPLARRGGIEPEVDPAKSLDRSISMRLAEQEESGSDRCPYIVGFYDAFLNQNDGTINMVLEWMDEGSLQDLIDKSGPLSVEQISRVLHCVLRGVKDLHERRILHRDIKPSNILLSSVSGLAKLSDFGISHDLGCKSQAITFVGSLSYMAPERVNGAEAGYSYPADIWSIGLTLFVCVTGYYPFQKAYEESGFWGVAHAVNDLPIPRVAECTDRAIPSELCDLIDQCLQRSPEDRPTAKELLAHPFLTGTSAFNPALGRNSMTNFWYDMGIERRFAHRLIALDLLLRKAAAYHASHSIQLQHTLPRFSRKALVALMKQLGLPHEGSLVEAKLGELRKRAQKLVKVDQDETHRINLHRSSFNPDYLETTM